nr:insulinase family protein [Armatimonadota bacterium]
ALDKAVRLAAYQVHPYRWDTIGFRADIENFTRDEMYAYYKNYYTPNNATVVIVGDFDTVNALALVRRYFGSIKPHPVAEHFITPEPAQEGERRVVVNRAGTTPQIQIVYHMPAFGSPDRYAIDVMEIVLSAGRTSRFFQNLVQSGLASSAEANDYGLRDADLISLTAEAQPGHTNPELEKALLDEVEKLKTQPISAEELTRAIRQAEAGYIFGKDSVQQQGQELGENAMKGDWRFGETYLEHLRKVTAADVQRVAQKYLVERNRTVGYFEPIRSAGGQAPPPSSGGGGPTGLTAPPNNKDSTSSFHGRQVQTTAPAAFHPAGDLSGFSLPASGLGRYGLSSCVAPKLRSSPGGARRVPVGSSGAIRRPAHPVSSGLVKPTSSRPLPTRVVLDNGLVVVVQENHANPTVSISGAMLTAGGVFDPEEKRGLAALTSSQLSRGTETRSLLDIARILEGVGASVRINANEEYLSMNGRSLSRDYNTLLDVLSDELRHPVFPVAELERAKTQEVAALEQARQDTRALASIAFSDALFPAGHPYHSPTLDEQETVIKSLTRDDLAAFHATHYKPDRMILTIVGDVTPQAAVAAVKKYFGDWTKESGLPQVSIPSTPPSQGPIRPIIIPVQDKAQVDVFYGYPGQLKRSDPDFYRVTILNTLLGGGTGLSSRLGVNVRDKLGLVYGIYAGTDATLGAGPFQVVFGSNPANVDRAVAEMQRQLILLRDHGASPDEVAGTIDYITGEYPVTLSTNGAVAGQLLIAQIYGLGLDYIQKRNSYYRAVTPAQVNAAARKYIHPETGALVIAGTYTGKYANASH